MNPTASLTGSHLRTYTTIFQHPASHNLVWLDVQALFRHLGRVDQQPNGNLLVTRNGQTLVLHPPRTKDVADTDELMALRRFLERSETAAPAVGGPDSQWLLVINHHEARIYRTEMKGTVPEQILPHEPDDHFRHAQNSQNLSRGKEKPDPNSFFAPVAKALQAAGHVLVFGTGTGHSSEMDQFIAWTKIHQPDLAARIVGAVVVDEHHLTPAQLLAMARDFHAGLHAAHA